MDEEGHIISADQAEGLLLHINGTVCSDGFSDASASAICREMGYHAATSWRTGLVYGSMQSSRDVVLSDVICSSDDWSSCSSNSSVVHQDHEKDVLLSCEYGMHETMEHI